MKKFSIPGTEDRPPLSIQGCNGPQHVMGRKFDQAKAEYGLIPPHALHAMVEILTFGAQKYDRENWRVVPEANRRYFDALERHLWAWKRGEQLDPESGKHHLAHAMCCLFFLYEHDTGHATPTPPLLKSNT